MKRSTLSSVALATLLCGAAVAQTQPKGKGDLGKFEYESNCAVCHARGGQGNGPFAPYLKKPAPDLTGLAKRNGGIFPLQRVYEVIEGGGAGHGTREMPIWGRAYSMEAAEYYMDTPYDSEAFVRARVLALAEYLNRLQAK
ncbi:c-type cytochrome [Caldimonas sp. KR1-144]|uniref:c-type cytochrome n=1 Tax=Caldimonas sp. KR1-144 TaxID=3400911 RepID=UPI003C02580B